MDINHLIDQGNEYRAQHQPERALQCYAQAFVANPDSSSAWNNYGNVTREMGFPRRAIPFLEMARDLEPHNVTAHFNLAVAYLLMGDYARGWPQYEWRWQYEHLAGTLPQHSEPRWQGQDLKDKTILVVGEQGHGDNIQFVRFCYNLYVMGARVLLQVTDGLIPLFGVSDVIQWVGGYDETPPKFDYWCPIMSIPGVLGVTLQNMARPVSYINARQDQIQDWQRRLGPKTRLRVGLNWSGRRDSWLNQHKSVPFPDIVSMVRDNPQYEWINLQVDVTPDESEALADLGVTLWPGAIQNFQDTAALMMNLDVVVGVDTAVSHLSGALGRPTWIMLNAFATDWRWLLDRDSSPWYSSARLFRQPQRGDWRSVTGKVAKFLSWFKV